MSKPKIFCVVGPTASGKTAFAIALAEKMQGEVVSCDSMQIYRGMDIGTAKPTKEEMRGIPHHMLDIVSPEENFSVADFVAGATQVIEEILSRGKMPILCGGTGLYVDSILNGISFSEEARDDAYRQELKALADAEGVEAVHRILMQADPDAAAEIHPNNVKRVIRALEIIKTSGKTKAEFDRDARKESPYDATVYGMYLEREKLYRRIDLRVDMMMQQGLLDEVKELLNQGISMQATAMQAIGYKEFSAYLQGECTLEDAVETVKRESRRYAKRQMTWFRRNPDILWIHPLTDIKLL
ncbi:MAG: tRNA (adenosine(37)-N6)-dimethylallyltransferase MiaA [Clostridia bacterium]|nr:tRNA (adenosine(37)-N6)-dimethylallyltransferase MiaA [Clostridia bacterium]